MSLKNLLRNENDLHNCNIPNAANRQLALPQVKITIYGLHSNRHRTAKHLNFIENKSNLNFPDNEGNTGI